MLVLLLLTTAIVGLCPTNVAVKLPDKLELSKTVLHCLMEGDALVEYTKQINITIVLAESGGTAYCTRLDCEDPLHCHEHECNYVGFDPTGSYLAIGSDYDIINPGPFSFKPYRGVLVYSGSVSPFCEYNVRFSSAHPLEMPPRLRCLALMERGECSLMSYRVFEMDRSWLAYDMTLNCLGVKGDAHLIENGHHPDWVRVYHSDPSTAWTLGGELAYIYHRGLYKWVSTAIITHGLMIYDGHMRGYNFSGPTAQYAPSETFFLAQCHTLDGLLTRVKYVCVECGDSCPHKVNHSSIDGAGFKVLASVSHSTLLVAKSVDNIFHLVKIEYKHVHRLKREGDWRALVSLFFDSFAFLSDSFGQYKVFMQSDHFFKILVLYLIFYHIISLVPPAIILIVLFIIIMMWGSIDPG